MSSTRVLTAGQGKVGKTGANDAGVHMPSGRRRVIDDGTEKEQWNKEEERGSREMCIITDIDCGSTIGTSIVIVLSFQAIRAT